MRDLMLAAAIAAVTTVSIPAFAQARVAEITVTGHWREPPQSMSKTVSYADLDLREHAARKTLEHRVHAAAQEVCDKLGEKRPHHTSLGRSCQERAIHDAQDQVKAAIAKAKA